MPPRVYRRLSSHRAPRVSAPVLHPLLAAPAPALPFRRACPAAGRTTRVSRPEAAPRPCAPTPAQSSSPSPCSARSRSPAAAPARSPRRPPRPTAWPAPRSRGRHRDPRRAVRLHRVGERHADGRDLPGGRHRAAQDASSSTGHPARPPGLGQQPGARRRSTITGEADLPPGRSWSSGRSGTAPRQLRPGSAAVRGVADRLARRELGSGAPTPSAPEPARQRRPPGRARRAAGAGSRAGRRSRGPPCGGAGRRRAPRSRARSSSPG